MTYFAKGKSFVRPLVLVAACLRLLSVDSVEAGQIPSHIYTALRSVMYMSGPARHAVETNLDAYLSGAQGPDAIGVVMTKLDNASLFNSVGGGTHYSDHKAQLALNILDGATTDREKAYALGWISHYVNDMFVHEVVNNYGGYYEQFDEHHKVLEQLECKHVFTKHADIVTSKWIKSVPQSFSKTFAGFIFDAYHKTFPDNELYKSGNELLVKNRPYFCERFVEACSWCQKAGSKFYDSHLCGLGDHGWALATWPFPDMPTTKAYALLAKAIEITDLVAEPERVRVTVKINDNKLYGRFCVDWKAAADAAILYSNQIFTFASEYLSGTEPAKKAAARTKLLEVIPNMNLDQPKSNFDPKTARPGNVSVKKVTYTLTVLPETNRNKAVVVEGQSPTIAFAETNFAESQSGQVTFDITIPGGIAPYKYKLQVALTGKEAYAIPEYRDVDWTEAAGAFPGTWMTSAGSIVVTDIFEVRMPLPPKFTPTTKGARRWVIMHRDHELQYEDLGLIRTRLPNDMFRYDVEVIKEEIRGRELVATLQVTNSTSDLQTLLGRNKLVMIWFEEGKADTDVGGLLDELSKDLQTANKALEDAQATQDKFMTPEQEAKLEEVMTKYQEELTMKGVPEEQQEKLLEAKALETMKKLGIKPPQTPVVTQEVEDLTKLPLHVYSDIDLCAINLVYDAAAKWTAGTTYGNPNRQNSRLVSRKVESKDPQGRLMWTLSALLGVSLNNDPELEKRITQRNAGVQSAEVTIAGFTGASYHSDQRKDDEAPYHRLVHGEGALKKGKVFMEVGYSIDARGYKITQKNEKDEWVVVYDGAADAGKACDEALSDIISMYRSLRLNRAL